MEHQLSSLPFSVDALEPVISAKTIDLHYNKHHRGYVTQLNALIPGTPFEAMPLVEIVRKANGPIFNNAAQAWNHDFYWQSLAPRTKGTAAQAMAPGGAMLKAIEKNFLGLDKFKADLAREALAVFGSGWVWLVMDGAGQLQIETTSNADNPLRRGKIPLLTVDVWEHAYYLDYQNERKRYLQGVVDSLNWEFADYNFGGNELSFAV